MSQPTVNVAMLLYAVRYALGRQSYAVGEVTDEVLRVAPEVDAQTRQNLRTDIGEWLNHHDPAHPKDLVSAWQRAREALGKDSPS
jgi:hypothetical protein